MDELQAQHFTTAQNKAEQQGAPAETSPHLTSKTRHEGTKSRPRTIENQRSCTRESKLDTLIVGQHERILASQIEEGDFAPAQRWI
jgi:hypothetical protein